MVNPVEIFKALGDETRLRLVNLLSQTNEDICVCEMVDALELPQYKISKHLAILKNAGLLQGNREGTWVYYHRDCDDSPFLRDLFKILGRHLGPVFTDDTVKLVQRLKLRENGKCAVGFVAATEIAQTVLRNNNKRKKNVSKTARHFHLHA